MMMLWTSQVSCLFSLPITIKRQLPMKILHFWFCFYQPMCNHVLGCMYLIVQSLIILQILLHLWPECNVSYSAYCLSKCGRAYSLPVHFINFVSCTSILRWKCIPLRLFCEKENTLSPRTNVTMTLLLFECTYQHPKNTCINAVQDLCIPKDNMLDQWDF